MNNSILLFEIAAIMIAAGVSAIIFTRLRAPVIIGYLFAGVLLGSDLFSPLWDVEIDTVNFLADLGIILLMFTIGLDFNLKRLKEIGGFAILAGSIEVVIMLLIGYEVGLMIGWNGTQSIFLGAVLSISSTAVIYRTLAEMNRLDRPYADAMIGILIVEDLAAVIILTMVSPLAAGQAEGLNSIFLQLLAIVAFIILSIFLGMAIVPRAINMVGHRYSEEVLLLISLSFCFGMAIVAYLIGLSVAIGSFIIGVIISESDQREVVTKKVISIKEMFLAIFFVSIGLMIDPMLALENWWLVILIAVIFILGKIFAVSIACAVSNKDIRTSVTTGIGMVAMGEFSFVIVNEGILTGAISSSFYSVVIGAAMITIVLMPSLFKRSDQIIDSGAKIVPKEAISFIKRIEGMRTELNRCLEKRADRRRRITYQLFWMIVDFTIIFLVQAFVIVVFDITDALTPIADWLNIIPSLFASIVSIGLIIPPVIDMLHRIRKIGYEAVQGILEGGMYHKDSGRMILKLFVNLVTAVLGIILFLSVLPFSYVYTDVPLVPIVGTVVGAVVAWLLWDAEKATYKKMCTVLSDGVMESANKK